MITKIQAKRYKAAGRWETAVGANGTCQGVHGEVNCSNKLGAMEGGLHQRGRESQPALTQPRENAMSLRKKTQNAKQNPT